MPKLNTTPVTPGEIKTRIPAGFYAEWNRVVAKDAAFGSFTIMDTDLSMIENPLVFVMDESNHLKQIDPSKTDDGQMTRYAEAGRLFIRGENEDTVRQFGIADYDGELHTTLSTPISDMRMEAPPQSPPFWHYILYPFFAAEIREYNNQMKMHELLNSPEFLAEFERVCGKEPSVDLKPKEEPKAEAKKEAPKKESVKDFEKRLTKYAEKLPRVISILMKKPPERSEESIMNTMFEHARAAAAGEILDKVKANPEKKNEILTEAMKTFDPMMEDIKEFLPKTVDPEELKLLAEKGILADERMASKMDFICETSLDNYHNYLKNGDNFKQRKFYSGFELNELDKQGIDGRKALCDPLGIKKEAPKADDLEVKAKEIEPPKNQEVILA